MGFKNLKLRSKLAVMLVPSGLLVCILTGYFFYQTSAGLIEKLTLAEEKSNSRIMKKIIDDLQSKALSTAKMFAENPAVMQAYNHPDETAGSDDLMSSIKPIIEKIKADPEIKDFQIHFHKAPAKSFLRSWTKKRFDDLSAFRQTILKVYNTKKPIKAIEFGVGGFALRGIAPIITDGQYLGSVEFLYEIKDVLNLMSNDNSKTDMFNIVSAVTVENALKPEQIKQFYKNRIGDYYLSEAKSAWVTQTEIFDAETLEQMKTDNEVIIKKIGSIFYILNPVFDMNNSKIGFVAVAKNNEELINDQQTEIIYKVIIIAVLILAFIGLIFFFIDYYILRSIREAIKIANQVAAGNFSALK